MASNTSGVKQVRDIIIDHLTSVGADGLAGEECGCGLDDLAPCQGCCLDCEPARRATATSAEAIAYGCEPGDEIYLALSNGNHAQTGAELIAAERQRQISEEGWTADHDNEHEDGEMAKAACCYADHDDICRRRYDESPHEHWPWDEEWWKPSGNRIRDLTKAGALIAAEIDRLQRGSALDEQDDEIAALPKYIGQPIPKPDGEGE